MQGQQFWVVWNEAGHSPVFKHWTLQSAKEEAERLSLLKPGASFHVLELRGTATHVRVQWTSYDDVIPF